MPQYTLDQVTTRLADLRQSGERRPVEVCQLGRWFFLEYTGHSSGHGLFGGRGGLVSAQPSYWLITEQVFTAALDVRDWEFANTLLTTLRKQFVRSDRVDVLAGLLLEAQGQYKDADLIYNKILADNETNIFASKRKIAVAKAQGRMGDATAQLNKYLGNQANDHEAWLELCELYIHQNMLEQAAFCVEEVIMLQPRNHIYNQKYAEIQYTLTNYDIALKYFCRAIELCTDYLRGLYGIKLCLAHLRSSGSSNTTLDQLDLLATERITEIYSLATKKADAKSAESTKQLGTIAHEWLQALSG
ncbi:tetratricopeptide repeat domain-containing protein [Dimargaris cristalligena]|uniref:ER membrane protein complex subunit 2 n=1 Tax=Dimargaris cristalligena TaxID=215637 RepID=A0A4Q0A1R6_9FUNG|nr:tetratricopeptide repeat domain-containing protein [Dimargaris cristalligena]RKP40025.1 hypothetical protein BJ085DRAFT_34095 [Dimargaris cristalligena]|eukprot:RKP40025.1 hypothetical protein BJ085DRAFT_34095 [Dimargaris cristalligena]